MGDFEGDLVILEISTKDERVGIVTVDSLEQHERSPNMLLLQLVLMYDRISWIWQKKPATNVGFVGLETSTP